MRKMRKIILKDNCEEYYRIEETFRLIKNSKHDQKGIFKMLHIKKEKLKTYLTIGKLHKADFPMK